MKKILTLMMLAMATSISLADNNTYITVHNDGSTTYQYGAYTGERAPNVVGYHHNSGSTVKKSEWRLDNWRAQRKAEEQNSQVGLITRFGYAYNYDAFTYGVSLLYHWDGWLGVTLGFDGYAMKGYTVAYNQVPVTDGNGTPIVENNNIVYNTDTIAKDLSKGLPLWDVRFGLELGKYFVVGGLLGKTNVDDQVIKALKGEDAWFINNSGGNFLYGGFVTFMLPICSYVGLNMDFAVTNKTGFNVGAGINVTIPLKE